VQVTGNAVTPLRVLCACSVAQPLLTFRVRRTQPRVHLVVGGCRQPLVHLLPAVLGDLSLVLVAKSWELHLYR
jgi:hypothetical protein